MVVLTESNQNTSTSSAQEKIIIMEKKKNKKRKVSSPVNAGPRKTMNMHTVTTSGSKTANSKASSAPQPQGQLLEGMSSAEVTMIRRLAGNDPAVRKKTMRKLRKWLSAIVIRFPDTADALPNIEPNIIRVWKALFYCMWMSDKPLPQEQLAEHISNLVQVFGAKPHVFLLFVEWFFRTMSREWTLIDRFRLDKFMMLFRRFLRKTLLVMSERKWKADVLDGFIKIIRIHVFNHHPPSKSKKGTPSGSAMFQSTATHCSVGLQIHVIDVFLEELAKVDSVGLKSPKILKLLSPFIEEMASSTDDRILEAIQERIFHHLMKQSDVGIKYQEDLMGIDEEFDDGEDEDENKMGEDDNDDENEENDEQDQNGEDEHSQNEDDENNEIFEDSEQGPLDPRAGGLDVFLPQLAVDYSILAEKLAEAGGNKIVRKRNRGKLYSLASSFRDLVKGVYPLALPEIEEWTPAIPGKELKKATEDLFEFDKEIVGKTKRRKTKKQRRRDAKLLQQKLNETAGSEDTSAYLNDEELMDHVSDNYSSYVHEQMDAPISQESTDDMPVPEDKPKKKAKKSKREVAESSQAEPEKKKKKVKATIEFEKDELDDDSHQTETIEETVIEIPVPKKKKSQKIKEDNAQINSSMMMINTSSADQVQRKRKCKSLSPTRSNSTANNDLISSKNINLNELSKQSKASIVTPATKLKQKLGFDTSLSSQLTPNSQKKRVNFVLARNSEHDATDYIPSISRSPAIPFDANRTPTFGVLKTPGSSSRTPATGRRSLGITGLSKKRSLALDFF